MNKFPNAKTNHRSLYLYFFPHTYISCLFFSLHHSHRINHLHTHAQHSPRHGIEKQSTPSEANRSESQPISLKQRWEGEKKRSKKIDLPTSKFEDKQPSIRLAYHPSKSIKWSSLSSSPYHLPRRSPPCTAAWPCTAAFVDDDRHRHHRAMPPLTCRDPEDWDMTEGRTERGEEIEGRGGGRFGQCYQSLYLLPHEWRPHPLLIGRKAMEVATDSLN